MWKILLTVAGVLGAVFVLEEVRRPKNVSRSPEAPTWSRGDYLRLTTDENVTGWSLKKGDVVTLDRLAGNVAEVAMRNGGLVTLPKSCLEAA